jgi:hypothetical protein
MPGRKNASDRKKAVQKPSSVSEVPLRSSGEVIVTPKEAPARPLDDKQIHPRRPLPLVPDAPSTDTRDGN